MRLPLIVGLGANKNGARGAPEEALTWAAEELFDHHIREGQVSSLYYTEPLHMANQPWYHNIVIAGVCSAGPRRLLSAFQEIERRAGRDRTGEIRFGPRALDIDLLLLSDLVIAAPDIVVPHPRMHLREFVLAPLLELLPEARDPRNGRLWSSYRGRTPGRISTGVLKVKGIHPENTP